MIYIKIEKEEGKEKKEISIRNLVGRNLITIAVTIIFMILIAPVFIRPLFESIWSISYDTESVPHIYTETEGIAGLIEELASIFTFEITQVLYRVVKFVFLLTLVIIIFYCIVYSLTNILIQSRLKIWALILINIISTIITISISFFFIPYTNAFELYMRDFLEAVESSRETFGNIPDLFSETISIMWTYMVNLYQPVLISIFLMFGFSTSLDLLFKKYIMVDNSIERKKERDRRKL